MRSASWRASSRTRMSSAVPSDRIWTFIENFSSPHESFWQARTAEYSLKVLSYHSAFPSASSICFIDQRRGIGGSCQMRAKFNFQSMKDNLNFYYHRRIVFISLSPVWIRQKPPFILRCFAPCCFCNSNCDHSTFLSISCLSRDERKKDCFENNWWGEFYS